MKCFTESKFYCSCAGNGDAAVEQKNGRWFVTMFHAGFNSTANNGAGYATERSARNAIAHYQGKSQRVGK